MFLTLGTCATVSAQAVVYEPVASKRISCVWSNGQAIAAFESDSAAVWLILDSERLQSTKYMRLWCMYRNLSRRATLIEPRAAFSLQVTDPRKGTTVTLQPESPQYILTRISTAKTAASISSVIGEALRAFKTEHAHAPAVSPAATTNPAVPSPANGAVVSDAPRVKVNSSPGKPRGRTPATPALAKIPVDTLIRETHAVTVDTLSWYGVFVGSIHACVLRKNTTFPGTAINGYLYFPRFKDTPAPTDKTNLTVKSTTRAQDEYYRSVERVLNASSASTFDVRIALPGETLLVRFRPVSAD